MQAPTKSSDLNTTKLATFLVIFIACLFVINNARATETSTAGPSDSAGQVTLPLDKYQQLQQQAATLPLPAPSGYAVGHEPSSSRPCETWSGPSRGRWTQSFLPWPWPFR